MLTSFASHLITVTKCTLGYSFHGAPENILLPRNWNIAPFKRRAGETSPSTKLANNSAKHTSELQQARVAAKGFRATGLYPCDNNIFRPHDFLLASEDMDAAPVHHPALVKTSDQPSFSSANFSPFTSAASLRASDISTVPSLNLQPNPRGGRVKKITSSSYRNSVGATQKKKIKQTPKSKTNRLASNALLGPSKRRKRMVCRDPTPSDTPSDSDTDLTVPFYEDSTAEEEESADCVFCTGRLSEDHDVEECIRCAKYFRWAHTHCIGMDEDFVCEPRQGYRLFWSSSVLVIFLNSVTILCAFHVNYSPPQIRNTCAPN